MAEPPPTPPLPPAEAARRRQVARRRRRWEEDGRLLHPAGHALVVTVCALALAALLNAPAVEKAATGRERGWERDVATALARPLAAVSHALLLDRPRALLHDALGREEVDRIDTRVVVPPALGPGAGTPVPGTRPPFTPARRLRLWVAGDSLVVVPGYAILGAAAASPVIEPVAGVDGRIATGLERPDVFNWFTHVRARLRELDPDAVVLGFGGNDDHGYMTGLPEGAAVDRFGGPAWTAEYRRRVGAIMDAVARTGAYLVWIGLPITRDAERAARFDVINAAVLAEARERPRRVSFLDTYTMFAGDTGGFAESLRDARGRLVRVRASDGVHFERAGGEAIAREVLRRLNRVFDLTSWRRRAAGGG